jgi:hypothetical protein
MRCTLYAVRLGLHRALRNAEGLRSQRVQMQAPEVKGRNTEERGVRGIEKKIKSPSAVILRGGKALRGGWTCQRGRCGWLGQRTFSYMRNHARQVEAGLGLGSDETSGCPAISLINVLHLIVDLGSVLVRICCLLFCWNDPVRAPEANEHASSISRFYMYSTVFNVDLLECKSNSL